MNDGNLFFDGFANFIITPIKSFYFQNLSDALSPYIPFLMGLSGLVSALLFIGIIISVIGLIRVRKVEMAQYKPIDMEKVKESVHNSQWGVILNHVRSNNKAEWRLAIIEADNILDELLKERGYGGETLGERMKSIDGTKMVSLSDAWDAHKLRNQIAHQVDMEVTQRMAMKAIVQYERVFKELGYL